MQFIIHDFINIQKATGRIVAFIKSQYFLDKEIYPSITKILADFLQPLKKEINVFMEYPYVDKVYRDSYYTYFSTKYKQYPRDSIRLSFFSSFVKFKDILPPSNQNFLEEHFMGYCI